MESFANGNIGGDVHLGDPPRSCRCDTIGGEYLGLNAEDVLGSSKACQRILRVASEFMHRGNGAYFKTCTTALELLREETPGVTEARRRFDLLDVDEKRRLHRLG